MARIEVRSAARAYYGHLSPFLFSLCFAGALLVEGMSFLFGFKTQALRPASVLALIVLCLTLRLPTFLRRRPWLVVPVETFVAVVVILDITLILPWQAQAFALPLVDDLIRTLDLAVGFDHVAWMAWLNRRPDIVQVFTICYKSMIPQTIVIIVLCLVTGRVRRLDSYLCAFVLAIFLTSAVSILLPTRGIVAILDPALRGTVAWPFAATDVATYDALRSGALRDLFGVPTLGIVSFPSFHAASAVLGAWAFWLWPATRYPALALNLTMAVASIGCGAHYLMDILVGFCIAIGSIGLAVYGSDLSYTAFSKLARRLFTRGAFDGWVRMGGGGASRART
ncbi:phosphatase PAP2 family protein [Methylobacterium sp. NEAU 140]|uniref:phosphatase PAP2 family protein n=1 Tax=Methylobacterium sp. NEAU 140 TaxID=3064945 RepID=UPI002735C23D|nr:phosphatase PAP2 family protein [Methylobacterium sp. NEAU 140]MDP4021920.1 phosphatase PAP2 family protein [Methylobacterium sp. NEAU 140]